MTEAQEKEIQNRILKLEEERAALLKAQGEGATKAEVSAALAEADKKIAKLEPELTEIKKPPPPASGPGRDDPDAESPFFI